MTTGTFSSALIESHYLPSLEFFCAISDFEKLILENTEHYVKQSFRNRCYINTNHGVEMLVVPLTGKHGKVPFRDVRIESGSKWKNNQWRTLQSAYANAPFFEHYADGLNKLIYTNFEFLRDLNRALLSLCLKNLGWDITLSETVAYEKDYAPNIFDLRSAISVKQLYSLRPYYQPHPYYQVFGNAFAGNLSLVDLLFCEGPKAGYILKASKKDLNK